VRPVPVVVVSRTSCIVAGPEGRCESSGHGDGDGDGNGAGAGGASLVCGGRARGFAVRQMAVGRLERAWRGLLVSMGNTQAQLPCRSVVWCGVVWCLALSVLVGGAQWQNDTGGSEVQQEVGSGDGCVQEQEDKGASRELQSSWLWLPAVAELKLKQPNPARRNG
jgi:hypothetical protein